MQENKNNPESTQIHKKFPQKLTTMLKQYFTSFELEKIDTLKFYESYAEFKGQIESKFSVQLNKGIKFLDHACQDFSKPKIQISVRAQGTCFQQIHLANVSSEDDTQKVTSTLYRKHNMISVHYGQLPILFSVLFGFLIGLIQFGDDLKALIHKTAQDKDFSPINFINGLLSDRYKANILEVSALNSAFDTEQFKLELLVLNATKKEIKRYSENQWDVQDLKRSLWQLRSSEVTIQAFANNIRYIANGETPQFQKESKPVEVQIAERTDSQALQLQFDSQLEQSFNNSRLWEDNIFSQLLCKSHDSQLKMFKEFQSRKKHDQTSKLFKMLSNYYYPQKPKSAQKFEERIASLRQIDQSTDSQAIQNVLVQKFPQIQWKAIELPSIEHKKNLFILFDWVLQLDGKRLVHFPCFPCYKANGTKAQCINLDVFVSSEAIKNLSAQYNNDSKTLQQKRFHEYQHGINAIMLSIFFNNGLNTFGQQKTYLRALAHASSFEKAFCDQFKCNDVSTILNTAYPDLDHLTAIRNAINYCIQKSMFQTTAGVVDKGQQLKYSCSSVQWQYDDVVFNTVKRYNESYPQIKHIVPVSLREALGNNAPPTQIEDPAKKREVKAKSKAKAKVRQSE